MQIDGAYASEIAASTAKAAPPLTVSAISLGGIPLNEWVFILTILYTVIMIAEKVWKLYKLGKNKET